MADHLRLSFENGIARLELNRPDKRNALTRAMYGGLAEAIRRAENDASIRTMLITGGATCFTGGNDVADFLEASEWTPDSPVLQFMRAISRAEKPIVAAVNGAAVGVGVTMLLHCDLVFAGQSAQFRTPFVALGLVPEAGSSYLMPRMMGHQRAADLLLLGTPVDAETAYDLGFVTRVTEDSKTLDAAMEAAAKLCAAPAESLRLTKALMRGDRTRLDSAMATEERLFIERLSSPEVVNAARSFLKR